MSSPDDHSSGGLYLVPLVAAIGIALGVTVVLVTVFNYLVIPIGSDLGLKPAAVASAISVHLAVLIVALPIAGVVVDRFGAGHVIVLSALLFGGAIYAISRANNSISLIAAFAAAGLAGAGASPISYVRVIVHRFAAHRGLALGVALTGTGLGGIMLPMVFKPLVDDHGWRVALAVLAAIVAFAGVLAGVLVGDRAARAAASGSEGTSLKLALADRRFIIMALAFGLLGLALASVVTHLSEIFTALSFKTAGVPRFQAIMGIATIIGRLVGGALMDKVPANLVGAAAAAAGAVGVSLLARGDGGTLLVAAALIGLCTGTESDVVSFLSSRFFGLREFARIYGLQAAFFMIGFSVGPIAAAIGFERLGTAMTVSAAALALLVSAVLLLTLGGRTRA